MLQKIAKIIRRRMNISRISDNKIIQSLKKFERIEKGLKKCFENG